MFEDLNEVMDDTEHVNISFSGTNVQCESFFLTINCKTPFFSSIVAQVLCVLFQMINFDIA